MKKEKGLTKEIKSKQILYRCKGTRCTSTLYTWGEVKKILAEEKVELEDTDTLVIQHEEGYDHGDSARDDCYSVAVYRNREETDEEFEKRKKGWEKMKEQSKKRRHEQYLELKKEFEG